ncbi:PfkB family carbohydrate kinase [Nonomuraea sp. NPDC003754]
MSELVRKIGRPEAVAHGERYALDVVGVGALNLDFIAQASVVAGEDGGARGLSSRIAEQVASTGAVVEPGTEMLVDEPTITAVLEKASAAMSPTTVLGGSAFNAIQAIAHTKVGLRLGYVGVAGQVPVLGMSVGRQLDNLGVDRRFVLDIEDQLCGICFSYAEDGERTLLTHAGANTCMAEYLDVRFDAIVDYLASARVVHVTSFLDNETAGRLVAVLSAVKEKSPATRISFDPGHIWSAARTPEIDRIISLSDYLLLNYREFMEIGQDAGTRRNEEVASVILSRFENDFGVVIVKRPSGILAFRKDVERGGPNGVTGDGFGVVQDFYPQRTLEQDEVEDATGAGDVFAAGLLTVLACDHLQLELGSLLGMRLAGHKLRHVGIQGTRFDQVTKEFITSLDAQRRSQGLPGGIFIAHGGSPEWLAVRLFIEERFQVPVYSFESWSWSGRPVTDALSEYLERCSFAVCVLTAEDLTEDGRRLARQNVVHEVGLFQGRYGFNRVLVLAEEGCDFVPKVAEPHVIEFPRHAVSRTFYKLEARMRAEGIGGVDPA